MKFYPRTSVNSSGDIQGNITTLDHFKYVYNQVFFNVPLPNCTTYCYGRIMEQYIQQGYDISNRTASYNPYWWNSSGSHFGDAKNWYGSTLNIWEKGTKAKLGAIACWGDNGLGGHVAIVEQINSDGTVNYSESNYGGALFNYVRNQSLIVGQRDLRIGGVFQGFIYIPLDYDSKEDLLFYRRGDYVKIIKYGRASSFGKLPIAKGIGWKRYVLRVFKDRPYPLQIGDIKTGITTGFYKYDGVQLLKR